jgi:arginase
LDIELLLVPFDTGRRGWRMGAGPEHLLASGLIANLEGCGHAIEASTLLPGGGEPAEIATAFELMRVVAARVRQAIVVGRFPLVLSGNCNTAPGTLAALAPHKRAVFWFDAHADCNTPETTMTGFLDGMALAIALGWCWCELSATVPEFTPVDPASVFLLGARDVDPLEAALIEAAAIWTMPPSDVTSSRIAAATASIPSDAVGYIHCDLDVLDPKDGQANSFPVPGGLDAAAVIQAVESISAATPVAAAAVTAYAPEYDTDQRVRRSAFQIIEAILQAGARRR